MSRQGEKLSNMSPMVLARRMDKENNRCIEARKQVQGYLEDPGGTKVKGHALRYVRKSG